jgi:hypothetical protein
VPSSFEELESLPGVGHKTASVVMAQAFNYPAFPVDTHIHRLAQRWKLTSGKSVVQTERDLKRHFAKERWNASISKSFITAGNIAVPVVALGWNAKSAKPVFRKEKQRCKQTSPSRHSRTYVAERPSVSGLHRLINRFGKETPVVIHPFWRGYQPRSHPISNGLSLTVPG